MTSPETLDCRTYMAEDAMHEQADDLGCRLYEVEADLRGLADEVHRMLFDAGRRPLQVRAVLILQAIEAFEARIDLTEIGTQAEKVASLKARIAGFEREIAEVRSVRASTYPDHHDLELVALAQ